MPAKAAALRFVVNVVLNGKKEVIASFAGGWR
jgi:nickel-dependent lactate racemase